MIDLEHFRARVLQDALSGGLVATWRRREAAFLDARPRPGDFHGRATHEELSRRWRDLTEIASACARRAEVADSQSRGSEIPHDVIEAVRDAA